MANVNARLIMRGSALLTTALVSSQAFPSLKTSLSEGSEGARPRQGWAHPHPYDKDESTEGRFEGGCFKVDCWDLKKLYSKWLAETEKGGTNETWPWVWVNHNADGPHHVFYGVDDAAIERAKVVSGDVNNNMLLITPLRVPSKKFWHDQRFGIIHTKVTQVDFESKVLITEDERIIAFDTLYVAQGV